MRKLLTGAVIAMLVAIALVLWPYRMEHVVAHIAANPTGCAIDVQNYSGWKGETIVPGIHRERVADPILAYAYVDGCGGVRGGEPAALALEGEGGVVRGESCGVQAPSEYVCRVRIPKAPGRYRLMVEREAGKPHVVEIDVRRESEWRIISLDALMSV